MMQKHMLFRHCLDIATSQRISLQSKLRLRTIPDFRMSAKTACLLSLTFYFSKVSVVEIGSDKMLIVMLVSIKRVSKIVAFDL